MLDEEHGHAAVGADLADERPERADLVVVEPAGGLVEQQELRLHGERPRELDALLRAERQARDDAVGDADEIEIGEKLRDPGGALRRRGAGIVPVGIGPGRGERVADEVAGGARMGADHHVLAHRQAREQGDVLEGAADAEPGHAVRRAVKDRAALEQDVAGRSACRGARGS